MPILDGNVAILTPASSELIVPFCAALGQAGCTVIIADAAQTPAADVAAALQAQGIPAFAWQADISAGAIDAALQSITKQHGQPTILVKLPASSTPVASTDLSEADFRRSVEDNLIHAFLWSQAAGRHMIAGNGGVIVNVTTLAALGGWPTWLAQSATLGGVHNLVHTLAVEWGDQGVRVNALVCGVTEPMQQQIELSHPNAVIKRIPLGRIATPDDLAQALLYLVHPAASYVSGEILRVDGGWDSWGRLYAVAPKDK